MVKDSYYNKYLFCITSAVCLSSQNIGSLKFAPILLMLLYVIYIVLHDIKGLTGAIKQNKYVSIFIVLMLIAILRSNIPKQTFYQTLGNFLSLSLYYLSTCHIIVRLIRRNAIKEIVSLIIIPFLFLACLNLVFFFVGISKDAIVARDTSVLMSLIGFNDFTRVNFFFVDGVNSYGSLNGICLIIAVLSYMYGIFTKKFSLLLLGVFMVIALFTDSRGAMIFAILSILIGWRLLKHKSFYLLTVQPYLTLFGPILMFLILPLLVNFDAFASLSRGDNDLASGNSRFFIWGLVANDFSNGESLSPLGFGDGGLYKTPSYQGISEIFEQYEDIVINSQNSIITIILDFGLLSLGIFLAILILGINNIKKYWLRNKILNTMLGAILVYLLLIGLTEAVIGMYYQNGFVVFLYIFCLLFSIPLLPRERNGSELDRK